MNLKAQGMIIEVIIFGFVIFFSIAIFFLLTASDAVKEQNIEADIEHSLGAVGGEAAMTYILNQEIDHKISEDEKYNVTFDKVIQAYYSTDSNVRINGTRFDRDEVRDDIKAYLDYNYPSSFSNVGSTINYPEKRGVINITHEDDYIEHRNGPQSENQEWNDFRRKVPTSRDDIEVILWQAQ